MCNFKIIAKIKLQLETDILAILQTEYCRLTSAKKIILHFGTKN